ncbi:unnamed protein product [Moneuplotes crassus]|uniref:Cilia- and flagella-associated protein 36 n=1 Tax=Euplotes crassus TaxID=5936 RepID=A0AAD1U9A6_EUPCR|nr:unnamed protein product [Moneuplotes crassus]
MSKDATEDKSWLIDLILSFFHSAEWKAPVLSFIEEKCIVFDDEEENKLEYTIIHKEFKELAEKLIEAMLWELGATSEMFGEAFAKASTTPGYQKISKIIESIDNYEIFAKMMRKKNAALNEAAFKILQQQDNKDLNSFMSASKETKLPSDLATPSPMDPVKTTPEGDIAEKSRTNTEPKDGKMNEYEEEQMEIIRQMSIREEEERKKIQDEEEQILKQVLELSSKEHQEEIKALERKKTEELHNKEDIMKQKEEELKRKEKELKAEEKRIRKEKKRCTKKKKEQELATMKSETVAPEPPKVVTAPVVVKKPKKKIIKEKKREEPVIDPHKPGEAMYDLPPVSKTKNAAMMAADVDILREASNDIFGKNKKQSTYDPYADDIDFDPWNKKEEGKPKTMAEMLKEKLNKMGGGQEDKEDKKEEDGKESIEDRKKRLLEYRQNIVKKKQDEMNKELKDARDGNTDNKYSNNLFKELMSLDKKVNQKEAKKKQEVYKDDFEDSKPKEDDEAEVLGTKKPRRDMHSLFDSDDDDKEKEEVERKERHRKIMKEMAQENVH